MPTNEMTLEEEGGASLVEVETVNDSGERVSLHYRISRGPGSPPRITTDLDLAMSAFAVARRAVEDDDL